MSSSYVRESFKTFVQENNGGEVLIDLTAEYRELKDLLAAYSLGFDSVWMAVDFLPNDEDPITVGSSNTVGKYRETGVIILHIVGVAKLGASANILPRAELVKNALRGKRLGDGERLFIESVTPPNFKDGATLQFDGGFTAASMYVSYHCDTDL